LLLMLLRRWGVSRAGEDAAASACCVDCVFVAAHISCRLWLLLLLHWGVSRAGEMRPLLSSCDCMLMLCPQARVTDAAPLKTCAPTTRHSIPPPNIMHSVMHACLLLSGSRDWRRAPVDLRPDNTIMLEGGTAC
jgi:hypothetical protein